jgi:hypothetical protein
VVFNDIFILDSDITVFELWLLDMFSLKQDSVWHPNIQAFNHNFDHCLIPIPHTVQPPRKLLVHPLQANNITMLILPQMIEITNFTCCQRHTWYAHIVDA